VLAGEDITIAKAGVPLIDLKIHEVKRPQFGFMKGLIVVPEGYNIDEDSEFDLAAFLWRRGTFDLILLDSNALVWFVTGDKRLGRAAKNLLAGPRPVYFSPFSVAELELKRLRGRLELPAVFGTALIAGGLSELPLKSEDLLEANKFQTLLNHDPFDRLLLCQASHHNLRFMTTDLKLLELEADWIIDATE
jgi:PIN domain nuclease of toxin-antitoxin system